MRKLKIISLMLIVGLITFLSVSNSHAMVVNAVDVNFSTSAKAMCVLEKDSGRIIASKDKDICLANASTTKIITAITVIQNCNNLDEQIQLADSAGGGEGA